MSRRIILFVTLLLAELAAHRIVHLATTAFLSGPIVRGRQRGLRTIRC